MSTWAHRIRLPLIIACLCALAMSMAHATGAAPPDILILNSYHPGLSWSDSEEQGIVDQLPKGATVFYEYMDAKRLPLNQAYFDLLRQAYQIKYAPRKFDLVITLDDDAFQFILRYGEELFPDTPIVFCGVNRFVPSMLDGHSMVTGVVETTDILTTLQTGLRLYPRAHRICAVTDITTSGQVNRQYLREIADSHILPVPIDFLDTHGTGLTLENLEARVRALPSDTLIYYADFFQERGGKLLTPETTIRRLADAAPVPIVTHGGLYVGHGSLGGKVNDGYYQGKAAGDMAMRILHGTTVAELPVITNGTTQFIFDKRQMDRFHIAQRTLPAGSIVRNATVPFYLKYWSYLLGIFAFIIVQAIIIIALLVNIQRRRIATRALRASEERLRLVISNMPVILFSTNPEGIITLFEGAGVTAMGESTGAAVGSSLFDIFLGSAEVEETIRAVLEGASREVCVQVGTSQYDTWMTPLRHEGRVTGLIGVSVDVTERVRTQEALEAERERLAVTLRSIGDGVITTDIHGAITMLNRVAEDLTGWTMEMAHGQPLRDIFTTVHGTTREPCEDPVQRIARTGGTTELTHHTVLIARDGVERLIADSGAPIRDHQGRMIGVVLVFRDVTLETRLHADLQRAAKLDSLGILAGGIAHDFNNLLSAITGNMGLAQHAIWQSDLERALHYVQQAETAGIRARDLTMQLLTFARGGCPQRRVIALEPILTEAINFTLTGSSIRCLPRIGDIWPVHADAGQINQVMQNLLINAMQAMPDGGDIEVTAENCLISADDGIPLAPGAYVHIAVRDTGIGIPPEILSHIFDPFFSTKEHGNGLGLASVYSILKAHDGYISLTTAPGEGSTFHCYLPAQPSKVLTTEIPSALDHMPHGIRILVLDDEELIRNIVRESLALDHHEVTAVAHGAEAITAYEEAFERHVPYDLLILDLTIPGGMGGNEVLQYLRQRYPDVRAIASSGYANDAIMANYARYGFIGCLAKPYRIGDIRALIAELSPRNHLYIEPSLLE